MLTLLATLGAGVATAASPCILPMLPLLLGASASRPAHAGDAGRHRPALIVLGFVLCFSAVTLLFGTATQVLGLTQQTLRNAGAVVMMLSGLTLAWPRLLGRVMQPLGGLADLGHRLGQNTGTTMMGSLLLGMSMGLVWTPCAGPVLASALALIVAGQDGLSAASALLAYAMGAGIPMLAVAYGGQAVTSGSRWLMQHAQTMRQVFGVLMVLSAVLIHQRLDTIATNWISQAWSAIRPDIDMVDTPSPHPASEAPKPAPALTGITQWLNSPPLTLSSLRGQVVLVDFWTYACANCIHTLPHLKRWHALYKNQGLTVIGIHTPEFAFEREPDNVRTAIAQWGITYPVALDNQYRTWNAWHNDYWPALYLIDRQGRIVFQHVGEGDYALIEARIRQALQQGPRAQGLSVPDSVE